MNKIKLTQSELQKLKFAKIRAEICYYRGMAECEFQLELIQIGFNVIESCVDPIDNKSIKNRLRESYVECLLFWGAFTTKYYYLAECYLLEAKRKTRGKRRYSVNEYITDHFFDLMNNVYNFDIDPIFLKEACDNAIGRRKAHENQRK